MSEAAATDVDHPPTVMGILGALRRPAVLALGFLLLYTAANLIPPALYKLVTDDFEKGTHATADLVALALIGVSLLSGATNYLFKVTSGKVNEGVLYLLRRRLFQRLSKLGVDYYDRELPGQVAARAVYDLDRISGFTESGIYFIAVNSTLLLTSMCVITVWSPAVAANVLPFVPLLLLFSFVQMPISDRAFDRQRRELGAVVERMQEDVAGRYVIDSFGARPRAISAFHARAAALRRARRWSSIVGNTYIELMQGVGNLAGAALISTAGALALKGDLSVGSLVALELYLLAALGPIAFLSDAMQKLMAARASFRTLRNPFQADVLPVDRDTAGEAPSLTGDIGLDGVSFSYPGTERRVLHAVDLVIEAGSSLALVGPTGAGKTSVAKLVSRVYDVDAGAVRVGATDVRNYTISSYRRRLGIVPQDAFCFRGTLRENLTYGRPDATDAEIEAAVESIHASPLLLTMSGGLGMQIEEEGRNLTAAQRQLIALARALLIDPDILILDESTSSLDPELEDAVLASVTRLRRTTIFVTHRLPVARRADRVAVVDHGRIVEHGSHEELQAAGGP